MHFAAVESGDFYLGFKVKKQMKTTWTYPE